MLFTRGFRRACQTHRQFGFVAKFKECGVPSKVLSLENADSMELATCALKPNEVSIRMLAAPINPSDLNMVEGIYGVKAKLPAVGGNEGVGAVVQVGSGVSEFCPGDFVIPHSVGFGTWRTEVIASEADIIKIPGDLPKAYAASIGVNPCTAYRILMDFELLKKGDYIIQNGANSMVGLAVIQLAREMGIKTINVIRHDRPDADKTLAMLNNLGGDINVTDQYLNSEGFNEIMAELDGTIKLGVNCVGGEAATELARCLPFGTTLVSYGGMSRRPLTIAPEVLNYKQLKLKGFWISEWNKTHTKEERTEMLEDLAELIRTYQLTFFFQMHDFDDFSHALNKAQTEFELRKVVLDLDFPDRMAEHDDKSNNPETEKYYFDHFNSEAV